MVAAIGSQGAGPLITELIKNYAGTFPVLYHYCTGRSFKRRNLSVLHKQKICEITKQQSYLVMVAAIGSQGAGPLITELIKNYAGTFPVPITIVPGDLSKEEIFLSCISKKICEITKQQSYLWMVLCIKSL